ncbi:hypothetical protein BT67DRAFT_263144 [Trichocladium antarcticum]|uniref:Uncharacterized protein n=1 Tax=Trichocladium antarcticum TaxID=1450529 RepID=A0AAN6ZE85_9PEZI|nr:hypothetical protein BT67DRAFT_263144 [Trichocladium antarcticum]
MPIGVGLQTAGGVWRRAGSSSQLRPAQSPTTGIERLQSLSLRCPVNPTLAGGPIECTFCTIVWAAVPVGAVFLGQTRNLGVRTNLLRANGFKSTLAAIDGCLPISEICNSMVCSVWGERAASKHRSHQFFFL